MPLLAFACLLTTACVKRPETSASAAATQVDGRRPTFVVPLLGTEPAGDVGDGDGDHNADLRVLAQWLGDARVVGLGELFHGTHELHRFSHRLFAYLVEHEGFTVFALEVDQAHAAMLDDYVRGSRDDLDSILGERWWGSGIFYDEALLELLGWMRQYNKTARQPVRFAGYDLKQPDLAMRALLADLRQLDTAAAVEAGQRYEEITQLGGFGIVPSFLGYSVNLTLPLAPGTPGTPGDTEVRPLTVTLRVRTSGLSRGTVGFTVRAGQAAPRTATLSAEDVAARAEAGAASEKDPWIRLEATVAVPADVPAATVTVFHRGNGIAWFDGFGATLAGESLPVAPGVTDSVPLPLQMPFLQVMDYSAAPDPEVTFDPGSSLRIESDLRLDGALAAARRIGSIVDEQIRQAKVAPGRAVWLRQLARLVLQATEWRTLAEANRDVFLAENLTWIAREAQPGARILALAHTSHTERLPRRMGAYLAEKHGDAYKTVSMLPLEGEYRYFGPVATLHPEGPLQNFPIAARDVGPLGRYLASLASGDLLFAVRNAAAEGRSPEGIDSETAPDIAVLVRRVSAFQEIGAVYVNPYVL